MRGRRRRSAICPPQSDRHPTWAYLGLPGPTWASQAVTKPVPNLLCEISARLLHANSIILILARTRACQPLDRLLKGSLDLSAPKERPRGRPTSPFQRGRQDETPIYQDESRVSGVAPL